MQNKYSSALAPNNYTEDKKYTVKELDFAKVIKKVDK